MKKIKLTRKHILLAILMILIIIILIMSILLLVRRSKHADTPTRASVEQTEGFVRLESIMLGISGNVLYGLNINDFDIIEDHIERGESFSNLLNIRLNLNIKIVNQLIEKSKGVFELRNMRADNSFTAFLTPDSTQTLRYLVYNKTNAEYVMFDCSEKTPSVTVVKRDITVKERYGEGVIQSSLIAAAMNNGMSTALSNKIIDIYKTTLEFSALQKGDRFRVIYEEIMIDTVGVGIGEVYGIEFIHAGKSYMAISFEQGDEKGYWDQNGVNLRKAFLRAPLDFKARVSSKFGVRVHPITRKRGQHNGVDYACPTGTPILAIANGTVIQKGWDPYGGGNMIKIKHEQGLESWYLHMSRYGTGIAKGSRVVQGQIIGYVGSTGMSTGPHLDFRIKKNGKFINPINMPSLPSKPISTGNLPAFNKMKTDVLKVLEEYKAGES